MKYLKCERILIKKTSFLLFSLLLPPRPFEDRRRAGKANEDIGGDTAGDKSSDSGLMFKKFCGGCNNGDVNRMETSPDGGKGLRDLTAAATIEAVDDCENPSSVGMRMKGFDSIGVVVVVVAVAVVVVEAATDSCGRCSTLTGLDLNFMAGYIYLLLMLLLLHLIYIFHCFQYSFFKLSFYYEKLSF